MEAELSPRDHFVGAVWKHLNAKHVDVYSSNFFLTDYHQAQSESPDQTSRLEVQ